MNTKASKKKITVSLVELLLIVVLLIGFSYSFFRPDLKNNKKTESSIKTNTMGLIYTGQTDIEELNLVPGQILEKTFTVENKTDRDTWYNIYMQNIENDYGADVVYTLYETDENYENIIRTAVPETKLPNTNIDTDTKKSYLETGIPIAAQPQIQYFKMVIEYKVYDNIAQIFDESASFSGTVGIDQEQMPDKDYTITINPNGGLYEESLEIQTVVKKDGETYTVLLPVRENYIFDGWEVSDETSYQNNTVTINKKNVVLIAKWRLANEPVAKIVRTGQEYTKIQLAIDDALTGDTVLVLKNTTEVFANDKTLTIDFGYHQVTGQLTNTGNVVLINGSLEYTNDYAIKNTGTLTLGIDDADVSMDNIQIRTDIFHDTIDQQGIMNFYDGFVEGFVAIDGDVNNIPEDYSLCVDNKTDGVNNWQKEYLVYGTPNNAVAKRIAGKVTYYFNLQNAINNSENDGKKIYIVRNFEAAYPLEVKADAAKDVIIDLDRYTVNLGETLTNNKNLKIINSEETGGINTSKPIINNGNLEIEDVVIRQDKDGNVIENNGALTLKNTHVTGNKGYAVTNQGTGTLNFNRNTYLTNNSNYALYINSDSEVEISAGNIDGVNVESTTRKFTLTGGNINRAKGDCALRVNASQNIINGGSITATNGGTALCTGNTTTITNTTITASNRGISNSGTTTIEDITLNSSNEGIVSYRPLTINGGTINTTGIAINNQNSTLVINDVEATSTNSNALYHWGSTTVNGGTFVSDNGNAVESTAGTMTINGGTYTAPNGNAVYEGIVCYSCGSYGSFTCCSHGTLIVNDGTLNGKTNAIYNNDGILYVHGGDLTGQTNDAVHIETSRSPQNIDGGTLIGGEYGIHNAGTATLNIGNREDEVDSTNPTVKGEQYGVYATTGIVNFYDGILEGKTDSHNVEFGELADGYELKTDTDGSYKTVYLKAKPTFAMVNGVRYNSLNKAISVIDGTGTIEIVEDADVKFETIIPSDKNITIDLQGHTLNVTAQINSKGPVTITDSTDTPGTLSTIIDNYIVYNSSSTANTTIEKINIEKTYAGTAIYNASGQMTLNDVTITSPAACISSSAKLTTNGGTFTSETTPIVHNGGRMDINGTEIIGETSGISAASLDMNFNSGTITAPTGITGFATMNGGTINATNYGITYNAGDEINNVVLNGGTINVPNGVGINATGYYRSPNINIHGGTINARLGVYGQGNSGGTINIDESKNEVEINGTEIGVQSGNLTLNIKQGTIHGDNYGVHSTGSTTIGVKDRDVSITNPDLSGGQYGLYATTSLYIYDGVFKGTEAGYFGTYNEIEDGTIFKTEEEIIDETTYSKTYLIQGENFLRVRFSEEDVREYNSLNKAIEAIESEGTIEVFAGSTVRTLSIIPAEKNITLDMNGNQVAFIQPLVNRGTLTIVDSSNGETGALQATRSVNIIESSGTFTMQSGNITKENTNNYAVNITGGTGYIKGGKIESTGTALNSTASALYIEGGLVKGATAVTHNNLVKMTGGTLEGTDNGIYSNYGDGSIVFEGGTINVPTGTGITNTGSNPSYHSGSIVVTGGTINAATGIYNHFILSYEGGTINATGNGIVVDNTTAITGGTINAGTYGVYHRGGTLTIGNPNDEVNTTTPAITGDTYGLYRSGGTTNFYDGYLMGQTAGYSAAFKNIADHGYIKTDIVTEDNVDYYKSYIVVETDVIRNEKTGKIYNNVQDAIDEVGVNETDVTLTLLKNTDVYYDINIDKSITLDMDGHDLYTSKTIVNSANTTITNNNSDTRSKIRTVFGLNMLTNSGYLTISKVELNNSSVDNYCLVNNGTAVIEDVVITGKYGITNNSSSGNMTVKDSNISVSSTAISNAGHLDVQGGTYSGTSYTIYDSSVKTNSVVNTTLAGGTSVYTTSGSTVTVRNNTVNGNLVVASSGGQMSVLDNTLAGNISNGGSMTITRSDNISDSLAGSATKISTSGSLTMNNSKIKLTNPNNYSSLSGVNVTGNGTFTCNTCEIEFVTQANAYGVSTQDANSKAYLNDAIIKITGNNSNSGYGINANAGEVNIKNATIDVLDEKVAYGIYINNGTVTMGEKESPTSPYYGTENATVSTSNPHVKSVGSQTGIGVKNDNGSFNFYDGEIIGSTQAKPDTTTNVEYKYEATFEIEEESTNQRCFLKYLTDEITNEQIERIGEDNSVEVKYIGRKIFDCDFRESSTCTKEIKVDNHSVALKKLNFYLTGVSSDFNANEITYSIEDSVGNEVQEEKNLVLERYGKTYLATQVELAPLYSKRYIITFKYVGEPYSEYKRFEGTTGVDLRDIEEEEDEGETFDYDYTGSYETFTVPATGTYKIEAWGAQGGSVEGSGQGGKGAYAKGEIRLTQGETLYLYIGGKENTFNGGGTGTTTYYRGGGGSTDVRLVGGTWNNSESLASRIIVAGAGGGAGYHVYGGNGGTLQGENGGDSITANHAGKGGTQTTGGTGGTGGYSNGAAGTFGKGANGTSFSAAGGSGYYGGGSSGVDTSSHGTGGGGSSYISGHLGSVAVTSQTVLTPRLGSNNEQCANGTTDIVCSYHYSEKIFENTVMLAGSEEMPAYDGNSTMIGNVGNGHIRITQIDSYSAEEEDFGYNGTTGADGEEQVYIAPATGIYKLETWGAQGGTYSDTILGGYGSYSTGNVYLEKGEKLYINVGGHGAFGNHSVLAGGYNGGGSVTQYHNDGNERRGSGGGATHIAKKSGLLKDLEEYKGNLSQDGKYYQSEDILIVSGGGGGMHLNFVLGGYSYGGAGGGFIGGGSSGTGDGTFKLENGATQTAVGSSSTNWGVSNYGGFGLGASPTSNGAGAGGGFYGGGLGVRGSGGGSGYIGSPLLSNKKMVMYASDSKYASSEENLKTEITSCVSVSPTEDCAKSGDGHAKVTLIEKYSDTEAEFDYNGTTGTDGEEQVYVAPVSGLYRIETWGAQGGDATTTYIGGYGAYSTGSVHLDQGDKVYINVGAKGVTCGTGVACQGSYNGGGDSRGHTDTGARAASGGGATSVALVSGKLSSLTSAFNNNDILIVAGAGGGGNYTNAVNFGKGGHGGGAQGAPASNLGQDNMNVNIRVPQPATQTAAGCSKGGTNCGGFGYGGNASAYTGQHSGAGSGGGAGLYGGSGSNIGPGAGGSGYIGNTLLKEKKMVMYSTDVDYISPESDTKTEITTCVNENPTSNCAKMGNGYANIKLVSADEENSEIKDEEYIGDENEILVRYTDTNLLECDFTNSSTCSKKIKIDNNSIEIQNLNLFIKSVTNTFDFGEIVYEITDSNGDLVKDQTILQKDFEDKLYIKNLDVEPMTYKKLTVTFKYVGSSAAGKVFSCLFGADMNPNAVEDLSAYEYNYDETGSEETFTAPVTGVYKLETWGAQGGDALDNKGGYGAYSKGEVFLEEGETLYINVGGAGTEPTSSACNISGGYNGGGNSNSCEGFDINTVRAGSGGGATHISKKTGLLSTLENDIDKILIVSGGGGGADYSNFSSSNNYLSNGGSGGGKIGGSTSGTSNYSGTNHTIVTGGTQTAQAAVNQGQNGNAANMGLFGQGGQGSYPTQAGAGGGFYGGNAGKNWAGGGGSGYIGNSELKNKKMTMYATDISYISNDVETKTETTSCVSDEPTVDCAKSGNGYARVTLIKVGEPEPEYISEETIGDNNELTVTYTDTNLFDCDFSTSGTCVKEIEITNNTLELEYANIFAKDVINEFDQGDIVYSIEKENGSVIKAETELELNESGKTYLDVKNSVNPLSSKKYIITFKYVGETLQSPKVFRGIVGVDLESISGIDEPTEYEYTGEEQVFIAPISGKYKLETWGAQGGSVTDDYQGGYGAYSTGTVRLNKGDKLYINVGGEGSYTHDAYNETVSGGYNGGGSVTGSIASKASATQYQASGGGATSIATSTGLLSSFELSENSLLIASSGGGGSIYFEHGYDDDYLFVQGGHGGGISSKTYEATKNRNFGQVCYGATQSAGGYCSYDNNSFGTGTFGQGGSAESSGGGAGYYGGAAAFNYSTSGGTSYIGNNLLSNKYTACYDCDESTDPDTKTISVSNVSQLATSDHAKKGNGYARITYIEENNNEFEYTGDVQTFTAPVTGTYKIEAWGAAGGIAAGNYPTDTPGYGAYTKGEISLDKGDILYIYVGEKGTNGSVEIPSTFNGGGGDTTRDENDCLHTGTSGGGATDIRLVSGEWNNSASLASRIMVAAGAGGSGGWGLSSDAGTLESFTGTYSTASNGHRRSNQSPATQTAGGVSDNKATLYTYNGTPNEDGSWGTGGAGAGAGCGGAGGGGGFYGGAGAYNMGGGSGGSSYISGHQGSVAIKAANDVTPKDGCTHGTNDITCSYHYSDKVFTNTIMKAGNEEMPSYNNEGTMTGNSGSGHAKITLISIDESAQEETFEEENIGENNELTIRYANGKEFECDFSTNSKCTKKIEITNNSLEIEKANIFINDVTSEFSSNEITYEIKDINGNIIEETSILDLKENAKTYLNQQTRLDPLSTRTFIITFNYAGSPLQETKEFKGTIGVDMEEILYEYEYTGNYETFTAPVTGTYLVELWGASGGKAKVAGGFGSANLNHYGKGGYTTGKIELEKNETIYIYVGEKGKEGILGSSSKTATAYNGGGAGVGSSDGDDSGASGGGATDIRLVSGSWDDSESLASRIMVAGAGAGANLTTHNTASSQYAGHGGGLTGVGDLYRWENVLVGPSLNATQTTGYEFGKGQSAGLGNSAAPSGGGGGYYGGKAQTSTSTTGTSGGGGSSYISGYTGAVAIKSAVDTTPKDGCSDGTTDIECSYHYSGKIFTDAVMKAGNEEMPTHDGSSTMTGNDGNGYARISLLSANDTTRRGDSLLSILSRDIFAGYYTFIVNDEEYTAHAYVFNGNQTWDTDQVFGDENDVATSSEYANNMVVVKVNGDLTIDNGVTVEPYHTQYGGPKGFVLYVTGNLINNGTIDNSHGAYAEGQNVYIWKNTNGTYEYVPEEGASGGSGYSSSGVVDNPGRDVYYIANKGQDGGDENPRATGGGGAGGAYRYRSDITSSGSGSQGTSYSGGTGGGASNAYNSYGARYGANGSPNGGAGGNSAPEIWSGYNPTGGAGNPNGTNYGNASTNSGTGGLLIIYANTIIGNGNVTANGSQSDSKWAATGGGSGAGSINVFTNSIDENITLQADGIVGAGYGKGGAGGTGTINVGSISSGDYISIYRNYLDDIEKLFGIDNNLTDLFFYDEYDNGTWSNSISDGNTMNIYGTPTVSDEGIGINAKNNTYATIQLDKSKDIVIHMVAKAVERSGDNGRFFEIPYSMSSFGNQTPTVFINGSSTVGYGIFTNDSYTSVSALKDNAMTLTINKDTKEMKFYINGTYQGSKTLSNYGDVLYLAKCNYNSAGLGNMVYKMVAIEDELPTDAEVIELHNKLIQKYGITN